MGRTLDEAVAALMVALEKRSADAAMQLKEVAQTTGMAQGVAQAVTGGALIYCGGSAHWPGLLASGSCALRVRPMLQGDRG